MRKPIYLILSGSFLLSCLPKGIADIHEKNYLAVETGYRWDKVSNRVVVLGQSVGPRASTQVAKALNSYQLGIRGQGNFYDNWYGKGMAHYGWIFSGKYREEGAFFGSADGHTIDATGGTGYLFTTCQNWGFAPLIGWSYDEIDTWGKQVTPQILHFIRSVGDIHYKSRFQGPWIGVDFLFQPTPAWDINLSYELHGAHWHATRILARGELGNPPFGTTSGFSNVRNHHSVWGNVFELGGMYTSSSCINFGASLRYQYWQSIGTGHYKRTKTPLDPAFTQRLCTDVEWYSFAAMVRLGYSF